MVLAIEAYLSCIKVYMIMMYSCKSGVPARPYFVGRGRWPDQEPSQREDEMTETSPEAQFAAFGAVEAVPTSNFQGVAARAPKRSWTQVPTGTPHDAVAVPALHTHRGTLHGH